MNKKAAKSKARVLNYDLKSLALGLLGAALLMAGLIYIYYPAFVWMVDRWTVRDSYYGHGCLIPLVSLYWLYQKRDLFLTPSGQTGTGGLYLILVGAVTQIASYFLRFYFLSAFSFVLVLMGIVFFYFGGQVFKKTWFPLAFLFLMVPLPLLVIAQVTLKMKFFVSQISAGIVNFMGIAAARHGSYIYTPHAVLVVGDPCSGLRSFLAFFTLGFVFAYDEKLTFGKKAVLVFSGLPLAIISNVVRVTFLTLVGEIYGMQYTGPESKVHDASGIGVFILAFLIFMMIKRKLEIK